ncbi:MAG: adaptor protein MecA [Clostridia bacterium]|nr:adaptor protein MecA [Clostridia bacterium]
MELIIINEYKIKIVMTEQDMLDYGLDENEFYCSVTNTRDILEKIIHKSGIRTGFENINKSERLLIQLYPEKSGGCELYVTRLEMELGEETAVRRDNENKALVLSESGQLREGANELAFSFEDLRAVSMACRELKSCAFSGESSLYFGKNKKYYLFLCEADENKKGPSTELLSEFGEPEIRAEISTLMLEYGKCVMDRCAVETLSKI